MLIRYLAAALLLATSGVACATFTFGPYQTSQIDGWADAVAIGDVTGDRLNDVVVTTNVFGTNNKHHVFVYAQQANGTLAPPIIFPYQDLATESGLTLGDMNGDNVKDIIVGSKGISIFSKSPRHKSAFYERHYYNEAEAHIVQVMDVDHDGHLDVIGAGSTGAVIYFGDGAGGIRSTKLLDADAGHQGYADFKIADVNHDGFQDLVAAFGINEVSPDYLGVYYNHGHSGFQLPVVPVNFTAVGAGGYANGIGTGDFNGDGRTDIAAPNGVNRPYSLIEIYFQRSDGSFAPGFDMQTADIPGTMLGGDVNGDGYEDLLVYHDGWNMFGLFQQGLGGYGLLSERGFTSLSATRINKQGMALGDINGDHCNDVVIANYNYGLVRYYGTGCPMHGDLSIAVASGPGRIAVGLASAANAAGINAPLVDITLSVRSGTLQLGQLPAECSLTQTAGELHLSCLVAPLPAGTSAALVIPVQSSPTAGQMVWHVAISATAHTDTPEWGLANNSVSTILNVAP